MDSVISAICIIAIQALPLKVREVLNGNLAKWVADVGPRSMKRP
jgi:hypothetical protein